MLVVDVISELSDLSMTEPLTTMWTDKVGIVRPQLLVNLICNRQSSLHSLFVVFSLLFDLTINPISDVPPIRLKGCVGIRTQRHLDTAMQGCWEASTKFKIKSGRVIMRSVVNRHVFNSSIIIGCIVKVSIVCDKFIYSAFPGVLSIHLWRHVW